MYKNILHPVGAPGTAFCGKTATVAGQTKPSSAVTNIACMRHIAAKTIDMIAVNPIKWGWENVHKSWNVWSNKKTRDLMEPPSLCKERASYRNQCMSHHTKFNLREIGHKSRTCIAKIQRSLHDATNFAFGKDLTIKGVRAAELGGLRALSLMKDRWMVCSLAVPQAHMLDGFGSVISAGEKEELLV
jgi:hypothetical protein